MEPVNIDWDNIDSTFIEDEAFENFDAPKWVDLTSSDELVNDDSWFCNHNCKHPKAAEDFHKPSRSSKVETNAVKLLRFATISEILPFRDRSRRENSSVAESSNAKSGPLYSGSFSEDRENKNPNFSGPIPSGRANRPKKPILMLKRDKSRHLDGSNENPILKLNRDKSTHLDGSNENPAKNDKKKQLKSTFSAQNLLGGREILSQITEFCSELKKLARKGSRKGTSEKASSGVLEEVKVKGPERERMPFLVVKEEKTLKNGGRRKWR